MFAPLLFAFQLRRKWNLRCDNHSVTIYLVEQSLINMAKFDMFVETNRN